MSTISIYGDTAAVGWAIERTDAIGEQHPWRFVAIQTWRRGQIVAEDYSYSPYSLQQMAKARQAVDLEEPGRLARGTQPDIEIDR